MKIKTILIPLVTGLCLAFITSCQEKIDLTFKNETPQIMIEGTISDADSIHYVKITQSVNFNDYNEFPPVTGAEVWLNDETDDISDSLTSNFPGIYTTNRINGISGHTYSLKVVIGNQIYTSECTMPEKVLLDSLSQTEISMVTKKDIELVAHFTDPPQEGNCYKFVKYGNGLQSRSFYVRNDLYTNGNPVAQTLVDQNIKIEPGDTMEVDMQAIDKKVYEYFHTLMQLQGNNIYRGTSPSNPVSNIAGGCLGYFSAYTSSKQVLIIK